MDGIDNSPALGVLPGLARTPIAFMTARAMQHGIKHYQSLGDLT